MGIDNFVNFVIKLCITKFLLRNFKVHLGVASVLYIYARYTGMCALADRQKPPKTGSHFVLVPRSFRTMLL